MRPNEAPEFTIADVRAAAVVSYKEMLWALRDHETTIRVAASILERWEKDFEVERAAFLRASPEFDPDLALAGLKYMFEHPEEIASLTAIRQTEIDVVQAQRAGLQGRIEETIASGDQSVAFVMKKRDAN